MILSFSISNYRSIKDKITLSLLPVKGFKELPNNLVAIGKKDKVLRSAVIYGANASGKSNLLKALTDFLDFIKDSSGNKLNDTIKIYDPFLLDKQSMNNPSEFELEFMLNDVRYEYNVRCNATHIISEHLSYYPKGQIVRLFERDNTTEFKYGTVLKGEKRSIENRLLNNQLYLSKAANEKLDMLVEVYKYFSNSNSIYSILGIMPDFIKMSTILGSVLNEDNVIFKKLENIITSLDVGIDSLRIKTNTDDTSFMSMFPASAKKIIKPDIFPQDIPSLEYELFTVHKVFNENNKSPENIEFPLERESSGTKNLFTLAISLLETFDSGSLMTIDEFEKSLHPHIVKKLIQLFHDPEVNTKNAQLIFSTHAVNLLDSDLFRRDQIWFTEKNEQGVTELFSLSQVDGIRKNIPYDKWYLSGRFGATPVINEPDLNSSNAVQTGK